MSGRFVIRPAKPEDARDIAEIHFAGWQNAYHGVVPPEQMERKRPERRIPFWQERIAQADEVVLVAHDETGGMQGFIHGGKVLPHDIRSGSLDGFDCEIYVLHCRKETQGKGLGRLLIAAAAQEFKRRGRSALVLWAYSDNAYRPFYDKLGGQVVAEGIDDGVADLAYGWRDLDALAGPGQGAQSTQPAQPGGGRVRRHTISLLYHLAFSAFGIAVLVLAGDTKGRLVGAGIIVFAFSWLPLVLTRLFGALEDQDRQRNDRAEESRIFRLGLGETVTRVLPFLGMAIAGILVGYDPVYNDVYPLWAAAAALFLVLALLFLGFDIAYRAKLTLSPAGLDYAPFGIGPIAWAEIAAAELDLGKHRRLLRLTPRDTEALFQRGLPRQGTRGGLFGRRSVPPFVIDLTRIGEADETLLAAINLRREAFAVGGIGPISRRGAS